MTTDRSLDQERDEAFTMRIDDLLSSALQEQVREQQMMISAVQAAKESLAASERDLAALRRLVEERDQAIVDMLEARLAGLAGEESIDRIRHDVVKAIAESSRSMQGLIPLEAKVEVLSSRLSETMSRIEALHKHADDRLRSTVDQLLEELSQKVLAAGEDQSRLLQEALARLRENQNESMMTLDALRESMTSSAADLRDSVSRSGEDLRMDLFRAIGEVQMKTESSSVELVRSMESVEGRISDLGQEVERFGQEIVKLPHEVKSSIEEDREDRRTWGAAISRQLERIGESVETHLPGMKSELSVALDELKREVVETLSDSVNRSKEENSEALLSIREATATLLHGIDERIANELPALSKAVDDRLEQMAVSLDRQGPIVAEAVGNTLVPFAEEVSKVSGKLRQTNRQITESNSRMESFQESLIAYLAERDERIESTRDAVLKDLVAQLSVSLGRRDRMSIARSLKEADERRKDRRDAEKYRAMVRKGKAPARSADAVLEEMTASVSEPEEAVDKEVPKAKATVKGKSSAAAKKRKGDSAR